MSSQQGSLDSHLVKSLMDSSLDCGSTPTINFSRFFLYQTDTQNIIISQMKQSVRQNQVYQDNSISQPFFPFFFILSSYLFLYSSISMNIISQINFIIIKSNLVFLFQSPFLLLQFVIQAQMQLNGDRKKNDHSKEQHQQKKLEIVKKKTGLLKKKKFPPTRIYSNIDLKHVVNIGDVCIVNEDALRNPDISEQTLLKTLYHYKMISKVTLNSSFINIELKKNAQNLLPPEYFIERLRSFGDQQMCKIADHLENIHHQFALIKESCPVQQKQFVRDKEQSLLENFVERMQGRKYFLYFSEITPSKINLKNVVFSTHLLQALGCNIKNMALDFLKYKHIFFEVFTTKKYKFFLDQCLQNFAKLQEQIMVRPEINEDQRQQLTSFIYDDEVIRTKEGPQGIYEQFCNAKVRWFSPHPSICCFQILSIDEPEVNLIPKLRKIKNFQETRPEQELNELKKIGIDYPLLSIEDEDKKKQLTLEDKQTTVPGEINNSSMQQTNNILSQARIT